MQKSREKAQVLLTKIEVHMKKLILGLLLSLCFVLPCQADWFDDAYLEMMAMPKFPAGMTFLALYDDGILNADRSGGSPTATYSASRGASNPATFINSSGVLQLTTTSDVGRFTEGFYDTSGFTAFSQKGLMIESASTNFLADTMFGRAIGADDWSSSWGTITDSATSIINISGAKERNIAFTFLGSEGDFEASHTQTTANDTFDASGANINITVSFWAKGTIAGITTGTGVTAFIKVDGLQNDSTFEETPISIKLNAMTALSSTEFRRFTFSGTLSDVATDKVKVYFIQLSDNNKPSASENFDITITGVQIEQSPFATSFIPTTAAALTRNVELLKYVLSGNRTVATESCAAKIWVPFTAAITSSDAFISDTDDKKRVNKISSSQNNIRIVPNETDSGDSLAAGTTVVANAETTIGWSVKSTGNPNAELYQDGVSDATDNDDYTANAWGEFFYVGRLAGGNFQLNGVVFSIVFFDRVLSTAEHQFLHDKDWRTLR